MGLGKDELDRLTEQRLAGANFVTFSRQVADDLISCARRAEELERENEVLRGIARWFYEHHTHSFYTVGGSGGRRLMGEDV